jgi:glutathione S-transferase
MRVSPWSEKARWALDHHAIAYEEREYTPILGAPGLRWKLRRARAGGGGTISVPILFVGGQALRDSYDIAQYADRHGGGAPLFRRGEEDEVARWNHVSERAMRAGRALVVRRVADDPQARQEALAGVVPRGLRRPLQHAALLGTRHLLRKYEAPPDEAACRTELRGALLELRAALADGRRYLSGELGYADLAMAVVLQFVHPVDAPHLALGPGTRRAWTDLELAGELTDLVEWRDQLYARHRGRPSHDAAAA